MDLGTLFAEVRDRRSVWTVDWIGNPYDFSLRDGGMQIDIYVSRTMSAPNDAEAKAEDLYLTVPFSDLAKLHDPLEWPKNLNPERDWKPVLRTRGAHLWLKISPGEMNFYSLPAILELTSKHKRGLTAPGTPYRLGQRALSVSDQFHVLTISDQAQTDPLFCTIPCTEIVRHFFCTSSHLAKHLLTGWDRLIWTEGCHIPAHGHDMQLGLKINRGTRMSDALPLSEYLIEPSFRDAANSIRKTIQLSKLASSMPPFICPFPILVDFRRNLTHLGQ